MIKRLFCPIRFPGVVFYHLVASNPGFTRSVKPCGFHCKNQAETLSLLYDVFGSVALPEQIA